MAYVAWLVQLRHAPQPETPAAAPAAPELAEAAQGAAAIGSRREQMKGHGQKLTSRQESLIAALLTEPTHAAAAAQAGAAKRADRFNVVSARRRRLSLLQTLFA